MQLITTFSAKGLVLGQSWGGGKVAYPAIIELEWATRADLIVEARRKLDDGSLDSGMGFECLYGALLKIAATTSVTIDDKLFFNKEFDIIYIGSLSKEDKEFLETIWEASILD